MAMICLTVKLDKDETSLDKQDNFLERYIMGNSKKLHKRRQAAMVARMKSFS